MLTQLLTGLAIIVATCHQPMGCSSSMTSGGQDEKAMGMFELFEGNDASQNMVCTLTWTQERIMKASQAIVMLEISVYRAPGGISSIMMPAPMMK